MSQIYNTRDKNQLDVRVQLPFKQYFMSKFFDELYDRCLGVQTMYKNPLGVSRFRNDMCMCGSGKKNKHCHGKKGSINKRERKEILKFYKDLGKS